jgi:glycine/D-amino acid oxidase-like deaminating enzyme
MSIEQALPGVADVVVIGAGAFGLATSYHLMKNGAKNVVLLDQYEPASQVSPKAAGFFKLQQTTETMTKISRRAIDVVSGFEKETGVTMPHRKVGSLLVARTPQHAAMIDVEAEDSSGWGLEINRIDGKEANRLAPFLEGDRLLGAYHIPGDIYVEEPKSMLSAYLQASRKLGLQIFGHTRVSGVTVKNGEVTAVETERGTILTPTVVDAAGPWARRVAKRASTDVAIQTMRHQLRITAPILGVDPQMPLVRMIDAACYMRPARGGIMYGYYENDPLPFDLPDRDGFTIDMVPLDSRVLDHCRDLIGPDVPSVVTASSQDDRGGLYTMTPDGLPLVGPKKNVRGFWTATGCNGTGFSFSSGIGSVLSEWILGGEPPFDLSIMDPNRFDDRALDDGQIRDLCTWQYTNYYTPPA